MRRCVAATISILLGCQAVVDVAAQETRRTFEVASVRLNTSGDPGSSAGSTSGIRTSRGGRFIATNETLESLIRWAYGPLLGGTVRAGSLIGGPAWIRRSRFDVNATAGRDVSLGETFVMVQALLEDRFGLVVGQRQLERDIYVLSLARDDGRLGPNLRRSPAECHDPLAFLRNLDENGQPVGAPPPAISFRPFEPSEPLPRGNRLMSACATMPELSRTLSQILETAVVDMTGLEGAWDYMLAYAGFMPVTTETGPAAPVIFTAVEDQLGLKLERQSGNVDVLVVEAVHELIEN